MDQVTIVDNHYMTREFLESQLVANKERITQLEESHSRITQRDYNTAATLNTMREAMQEWTFSALELGSINESEAEEIANLTGLRTQAVQKFIEDNNINDRKLLAYLKLKGPHTLSNRMDMATAIVGKPGNKYSQGIIKAFSK